MKCKIFLLSNMALLAAATAMAAQPADVFVRCLENSRWKYNMLPDVCKNPAMMWGRYPYTLNELDVAWDYEKQQDAPLPQAGNGHNRADAEINAYVKKGRNDIWGSAGYSNGQRRNVLFNETSDYLRLYPYVTADTVGGDLHEESYNFGGGFARNMGKVTIGAYAAYDALLAYRAVDPRPRNLVGNLAFSLGMAWNATNSTSFGISVNAEKYKQTNKVSFYNEYHQPIIYHATGLGTDYYRFQGSYSDTYYNGRTFGGMLSARHTASSPQEWQWAASAGYEHFSFDKVISSLNELPMASVGEDRLLAGFEAGKALSEAHTLHFGIIEHYTRRNGNENIFGDPAGNAYPQIASLNMYRHTANNLSGTAGYEYNGRLLAGISLSVGHAYSSERYARPLRRLETNFIYEQVSAKAAATCGKWLWQADAYARFTNRPDTESELPATSSAMLVPVESLRTWLSNASSHFGVSLRGGRQITPQIGGYARLSYHRGNYSAGAHADRVACGIGVVF